MFDFYCYLTVNLNSELYKDFIRLLVSFRTLLIHQISAIVAETTTDSEPQKIKSTLASIGFADVNYVMELRFMK